jgi:hypothetical protein
MVNWIEKHIIFPLIEIRGYWFKYPKSLPIALSFILMKMIPPRSLVGINKERARFIQIKNNSGHGLNPVPGVFGII